jgi:NAD(P)-dependent dehydrogenase (short-subunit alcohol dehydrogenase family)
VSAGAGGRDAASARALPPLPARVLVTGASRGIGAAIAQALIAQGVKLAAVGRDRAALEAVVGEGSDHALLVADLERTDTVVECVERAADALGGLDGFVSCAGVVEYAGIGAITAAALRRQLAVNLVAPTLMAQRAAQLMGGQARGGAMLMVASTVGLKPAPLTAAYAASKAGLVSMTRSLALELGADGIRVNAIAPGVVDTDMIRVVRPSPGRTAPAASEVAGRIAEQVEALRALHPLGRLGTPDDIAETALYLLRAPYVTGAVVTADGGLLLGSGEP